MGRPKGATGLSSSNPNYALTPEKYSAMLKAYLEMPKVHKGQLMEAAGVGRPMINRALTTGWPELNLPSLPDADKALVDPQAVVKLMASMNEAHEEIATNMFGNDEQPKPVEIVQETNRIKAEGAMAARVATSVAVKSAKAIEMLADKFAEMIENDQIDIPDRLRPEHLLMLAKAADISAGAVHKALTAEKIVAKAPEEAAGSHITAMLVGATAEELRSVVLTGHLPPRLLGLDKKPVIDVASEPSKTDVVTTQEQKKEDGSQDAGKN